MNAELMAMNPNIGAGIWIAACLVGLFIILRPLFRSKEIRKGDWVKVIANVNGHRFKLGERVYVTEIDMNNAYGVDYRCINMQGKEWFLVPGEVKKC